MPFYRDDENLEIVIEKPIKDESLENLISSPIDSPRTKKLTAYFGPTSPVKV